MILRSNCNSNFVNVSAKVVLFYKICKHISRFLIIIVIECDIQGRRQLYTIGSGLVISAEQFPLHRHEKWGGVTIVTKDNAFFAHLRGGKIYLLVNYYYELEIY